MIRRAMIVLTNLASVVQDECVETIHKDGRRVLLQKQTKKSNNNFKNE
jgi:hypothetical protein